MTDRIGARFLSITRVLFLMVAFLIGASLRADSHWILPTTLLALVGYRIRLFQYTFTGDGELTP